MSTIVFRDYDPSNPWTVTGEQKTITNGYITLNYAPLNGSLSIPGFTATANNINIGTNEFYIDYNVVSNYKAADQRVYFNTANNGSVVTCGYQGVAQIIFAVHLNSMMQHTVDSFVHAPAPAASGFLKTSTGNAPTWANISWDDIQNKPNFADASWKSPVSTPAELPLIRNVSGDLRLVINDGDGDGAIYSCIATTGGLASQWEKIADVGFATPSWSAINNKPSTAEGFGITNALTTATASSSPTANKLLYLDSSAKFNGSVLTDGTITDAKLGNRTVDQSLTTTTSTGTLTNILSWFAGMVKAITGETNWYTSPQTTLSAAKDHIDATSAHGATSSNYASTIVMRNNIKQIFANSVILNDVASQIELGSTTSVSAPYIDFHSSGSANDYDARIIVTGGTSGAFGLGSMFMYSPKVCVTSSAQPTTFRVNADGGYASYIIYSKGNLFRWRSGADSATESGSNVGSDYYLARYNDSGTYLGTPFGVTRSTGRVSIGDTSDQLPIQLQISDSAHTTSRRAGLGLGSAWSITQDVSGNGSKDFGINNQANSITPFKISADGTIVTFQNTRSSDLMARLDCKAGQTSALSFTKGTSLRWNLACDNVAESGSNAGSNLYLTTTTDAGAYLRTPLYINRTGKIQFNSGVEAFLINSSKAVTDARLPRTLSIPGGTDYASNFMLCPDAMTLASVRVLLKSTIGVDVTPSAATSIVIKKVISSTTTTIATISNITVASTTYDVSPDASIEAGAYVYAQFSGANNGVDVANVILVWA